MKYFKLYEEYNGIEIDNLLTFLFDSELRESGLEMLKTQLGSNLSDYIKKHFSRIIEITIKKIYNTNSNPSSFLSKEIDDKIGDVFYNEDEFNIDAKISLDVFTDEELLKLFHVIFRFLHKDTITKNPYINKIFNEDLNTNLALDSKYINGGEYYKTSLDELESVFPTLDDHLDNIDNDAQNYFRYDYTHDTPQYYEASESKDYYAHIFEQETGIVLDIDDFEDSNELLWHIEDNYGSQTQIPSIMYQLHQQVARKSYEEGLRKYLEDLIGIKDGKLKTPNRIFEMSYIGGNGDFLDMLENYEDNCIQFGLDCKFNINVVEEEFDSSKIDIFFDDVEYTTMVEDKLDNLVRK